MQIDFVFMPAPERSRHLIYSEMILIKIREAERVAVNHQHQAPQRNRHLSLRRLPLLGAYTRVYLL